MPQNISLEDKHRIVKRIEKHINEEGNGYCAITFASKEVLGYDFRPKYYNVESIAALATKSGKYKKERIDNLEIYDYNISLNSESNWIKRNPITVEIIRFLITVTSAVLIAWFTK
jgi:hypothetical protein